MAEHILGKTPSQWISTSWQEGVAMRYYMKGADKIGVVKIDLMKVPSNTWHNNAHGIKGYVGPANILAHDDHEVTVEGYIPREAIVDEIVGPYIIP